MDKKNRAMDSALHPDLITKAPGSRPTGTALGAAAGGAAGVGAAIAAGAATGTMTGPLGSIVGAAVGAIVGAVTGGLIGKGVAEHVSPTEKLQYPRQHDRSRPHGHVGASYDDHASACQPGQETRVQPGDGKIEFDESKIERDRKWDRTEEESGPASEEADPTAGATWDRVKSGRSER